jgi:hypothetical protein
LRYSEVCGEVRQCRYFRNCQYYVRNKTCTVSSTEALKKESRLTDAEEPPEMDEQGIGEREGHSQVNITPIS